jgi:hypothetical protein
LNFLNTLQGIDEARMERFRKTIKISTTLSIVYLILYRELTGSIQKHIEEFTKFVGNFLKKWLLEAQKVEDKFTRTWYDLANKRDTGATAKTYLGFSWRIVDYWMRAKNNNPSKHDELIYCHKTVAEIIGKILFFSNSKRA